MRKQALDRCLKTGSSTCSQNGALRRPLRHRLFRRRLHARQVASDGPGGEGCLGQVPAEQWRPWTVHSHGAH